MDYMIAAVAVLGGALGGGWFGYWYGRWVELEIRRKQLEREFNGTRR